MTVEEDADLRKIARLLTEYRIKRVPVVRDGRIVGIVGRADLLRARITGETALARPGMAETGHGFPAWGQPPRPSRAPASGPAPTGRRRGIAG